MYRPRQRSSTLLCCVVVIVSSDGMIVFHLSQSCVFIPVSGSAIVDSVHKVMARGCGVGLPTWRWHKARGARMMSGLSQPPSSRPPFAVRISLVGAASGLFTPLFATAGVAIAWHRLMPAGSIARAVSTAIVGGGAFTLCYTYVWPFLREHAELVAPFAAANSVASMATYAALEASVGLEAMGGVIGGAALDGGLMATLARVQLPLGGLAVGIGTALCAPLLWSPFVRALWSDELREVVLGGEPGALALVDAYVHIFVPVALPVAIASGISLHYLLAPLLVGIRGVPWTRAALPALAGLVVVSATYMQACRTPLVELYWVRRWKAENGVVGVSSRNLLTGELRAGAEAAERASAARSLLVSWVWARESWALLGRALRALSGTGARRITFGGAAQPDADAERLELLALLAECGGGGAARARPRDGGDESFTSVCATVPKLSTISGSLEPLDLAMDLCVAFAATTHGVGVTPAGPHALDHIRALGADELEIGALDIVASDLCAASALLHGCHDEDEVASRTARLCAHAAKQACADAVAARDVQAARRARVRTRALFAHVRTFDARLRALAISVRHDDAVASAEQRMRWDERAETLALALATAGQVAATTAIVALVVRALFGGSAGSSSGGS
jgi:hypothetical protein